MALLSAKKKNTKIPAVATAKINMEVFCSRFKVISFYFASNDACLHGYVPLG